MLIKQLSDEDVVVLEVIIGKKKIITTMYFDINRQIDIDLIKLEAIIQHANDAGLLTAMDSNSKSTS
jgi:hypothetical protein